VKSLKTSFESYAISRAAVGKQRAREKCVHIRQFHQHDRDEFRTESIGLADIIGECHIFDIQREKSFVQDSKKETSSYTSNKAVTQKQNNGI
jgi:hypothetical protein